MFCDSWFSSSAQITLLLPVPRKTQTFDSRLSSSIVTGTYKSNWNLQNRNKQGRPNPVIFERCMCSPPFLEALWLIVHWGSTCFIVRIKMLAGSQHEVYLQPRDSNYTRHSCSLLPDGTRNCLYSNHLVLTVIIYLLIKLWGNWVEGVGKVGGRDLGPLDPGLWLAVIMFALRCWFNIKDQQQSIGNLDLFYALFPLAFLQCWGSSKNGPEACFCERANHKGLQGTSDSFAFVFQIRS